MNSQIDIATVMPAKAGIQKEHEKNLDASWSLPRTPIRGWHDILRIIVLIFFLSASPTFALSENPYPFTSTQDAERFATLTKEIRCVVCQNQNIADSYAPLASDLRSKVYDMVLEKKSDAEIKNYLVQRYGEFILLRPSFSVVTAFLWLFPLVGLLFILFFLCLSVKTRS